MLDIFSPPGMWRRLWGGYTPAIPEPGIATLGLVTYHPKRLVEWRRAVLLAPEYTWADRLRLSKALASSLRSPWAKPHPFNAFEQIKSLEAPVYLFAGRCDRMASTAGGALAGGRRGAHQTALPV